MNNPLHIIRLSIRNFGIISAVAVDPDNGNPTVIAGDNGQGKSTILNAIETVLYGTKLAAPVQEGQEKAEIQLDLGAAGDTKPLYRIQKIIRQTENGPVENLKVLDADKKQVPSPAKFIESLIGSGAAIDPTALMQARPGERPETFAKRQAEMLMERLGLTQKATEIDDKIKGVMDTRKTANDAVDSLRARYDAAEVPPGTPDAPVDVAELSAKIGTYQQIENERERQVEKRKQAEDRKERASKAYQEALAVAERAQKALDTASDELNAIRTTVEDFNEINPPEAIAASLADARTKIATANQTNAAVAKKLERKKLSQELSAAEAKAGKLTKELEGLRQERLDIVRGAKLPIPDLELTAEALLYKGKPLSQESTGNQLRICSLLSMAEEPQCRVLLIREGALTSKKNRQIIYDCAKERGWSVWEEHFSETPMEGALWIQNGEVTQP